MHRQPKRRATSPPPHERAGKARNTYEDNSGPATSTYQRWNKKGLGLINKLEDIPEGWDWNDDDIHEDDLEANIQRCKERIEDGIMPQWWERKLKYYEKDQTEVQKLIASEPEGLGYDEVMRLKTLAVIKKALLKDGDYYDQMRNVTAMMEKYRARELSWIPGRGTYWANGVQLTEPEKFDWERFRDLSDEHFDRSKSEGDLGSEKGYGGIWVEGGENPGPALNQVNWIHNRFRYPPGLGFGRHHGYTLSIRVPGSNDGTRLGFLDDTGASRTKLFRDDLQTIVQTSHQRARFIQQALFVNANGGVNMESILELECCLVDSAVPPNELTPWVSTEVQCCPDPRGTNFRLGGPFLREMVYTATAPDGASVLHIARTKTALTANPFPALDITQATIPVTHAPIPGVAPGRQWRNLLRTANLRP